MEYANRSEDLDAYMVLGESGYRGISNLDIDIHPMWRRENFRVGSIAQEVKSL